MTNEQSTKALKAIADLAMTGGFPAGASAEVIAEQALIAFQRLALATAIAKATLESRFVQPEELRV
jgi:hypothetical protein